MNKAGFRSLFAASQTRTVAVMYGLLDSSVWIASYGASDSDAGGAHFALYYAAAAPCKLAVLLIFIRTVRLKNVRILWPFYAPIGLVILASLLMGTSTLGGVVQPIGAIASLAMTISILGGENLETYMKAFGISCLLACATFLFQVNFVPLNSPFGVWEASGRYTFIFGTQPNLGGEVLFAGFVAFCLARLNTALFIAVFALYFVCLNLMETRAAMLSILLAFSSYMYVEKIRWFAPGTRMALVVAIILLLAVIIFLDWERIAGLFLLNDEYRGVGSGYVGREERWEAAWGTFLQSPLFGVGFNYFGREEITPHSMWLGLLGMMGFTSIFIVMCMFRNGVRIYRANTKLFLMLISFLPMTIFNDRVLNLNPYPFLLFVLLFLPRDAVLACVESRELRKSRGARLRLKQRREREGVRAPFGMRPE